LWNATFDCPLVVYRQKPPFVDHICLTLFALTILLYSNGTSAFRNLILFMNEHLTQDALSVYRDYHGGYFRTLVSPDESAGTLAMMEMVLPQGAEPPLHVHAHEDETFYLLEGQISFQIGDQEINAQPGDAVFAPRSVPHLFRIIGEQAKFITLISPGNLWNYFMEFSTPSADELVVTPPQGPPPPEVIAQLTARMTTAYGITFM
jgi:quercetin dioxygenase-like cupin family protein